jgi:hypothetical protein
MWILDVTLCDTVCLTKSLAAGQYVSPGTQQIKLTITILLKLLNFYMYFHHLTSVCKLYILIFCKAAVSDEAKLGRDSL